MSTTGGKSEGVYVVSQAELDSGAFKLRPGPAIKVAGLQAGTRGVIAGPTTPVFVVSGSYERGVEGGNAVPVSVLTGIRAPVHDLAIPVYVESDDGQFAAPVSPLDLTAPNDLAAVAISDTEIDLTWTDDASDATGWKIERSPAGTGTWVEIDDIAAPATGYSDTGLTAETEYDYRVRAYAGAENGDYSNVATETTDAASGNGESALYQSLLLGEFWPLDEASGNRVGALNSLTLTDNNTVGSDTGLAYDLAGNFVAASSEYLSRASHANIQAADVDFWFAAWVYPVSLPNVALTIFAKDIATSEREYQFVIKPSSGGSLFEFVLFDTVGGAHIVDGTTYGAAQVNTWQFAMAWHDAAANTVNICVNGGTVDSVSTSGAVPKATATGFRIGANEYSGFPGYFNGRIGPAMIGRGYIPDADDRTFLFNAGAGKTLQEMFDYGG